jgi:hypothetical protein
MWTVVIHIIFDTFHYFLNFLKALCLPDILLCSRKQRERIKGYGSCIQTEILSS